MITLIRHGIEPLKVPAAIAEMQEEAAAELGGAVVCTGTKNTNDPEFNAKNKYEGPHISVETYWEKAPPQPSAEVPETKTKTRNK